MLFAGIKNFFSFFILFFFFAGNVRQRSAYSVGLLFVINLYFV